MKELRFWYRLWTLFNEPITAPRDYYVESNRAIAKERDNGDCKNDSLEINRKDTK